MSTEKPKGELALKKAATQVDYIQDSPKEKEKQQPNTVQGGKPSQGDNENVHTLILSEFKVKYDQLLNQFQQKKKQADNLLYKNKKLEVELLNHNVEYYEKEIVRLRQQVQKYQTENEDHKHKFFVAENMKKDLEATSKVKQEQLKQVLKQFQKQKITVVELRHQMVQKDKAFSQVLEEVQATSQSISQKYDDTSSKLSKMESDLKIKNIQNDQLRRELERKDKQIKNKKEQFQKEKEKHQLQQYKWSHRLNDFEEEIKEYKGKQNKTIKQLENRIKQLEKRCASQELLLIQRSQTAEKAQRQREKEIIIAELEEKVRQLQTCINFKNEELASLKSKLQGVCPIGLLQDSQDRYNEMMSQHKLIEKNLQNKISDLERELALTKIEKEGTSSPAKMSQNFQQLLKNQIADNNKLKKQLSFKIEEVYELKNKLDELHINMSLLENQIDILKKRAKAEEKNSKIEFEIEIQNLRNQIESLRRKLQMTETKLNIKIKEAKDKDTFITSVLIGRSKQEDVPFVAAQLKRIFQTDYIGKLSEANLRIADLQTKLNSKSEC